MEMTGYIIQYINERIAKLTSQLDTARQSYQCTKDESWAARIAELSGRISELETIKHKIERRYE